MRRLFSPVRSDNKLDYFIQGDKVTVVHSEVLPPIIPDTGTSQPSTGGKDPAKPPGPMQPGIEQDPIVTTDVFDFTGMPDGVAIVSEFETILPLNPFISVKRVNGEIEIEVINFIGANATETERFPSWEVL